MFRTGKPALAHDLPVKQSYDVVIVGSGMGGGTLAYALKDSGIDVLLIERGDFVPQERENWDVAEVFAKGRYKNAEKWYDPEGRPFAPGTYYYVGGNTKFYGASLARFRREDFLTVAHADGDSPAWFLSYDDMAPYYAMAEQVYRVHGDHTDDPTLPRQEPFPFPAVPHEPPVQRAADALRRHGLTPSHIPLGIDLRENGSCIRCHTCDGFPCLILAKSDADVSCVRPAIASGSVELLTNAYVERVLTEGGRASGVQISKGGRDLEVRAGTVVVSCGAVNSAALLLRSATAEHPDGLGNSSGALGRHYMVHNNTVMVGVSLTRKNTSIFQKTLYFNDFYTRGTDDHPYPLGHVQLIGKLRGEMLAAQRPSIPRWALDMAAANSIDWWLFTEDLPDPANRVTLRPDNSIQIAWKPNNVEAHQILVRETRKAVRAMGYPLVFSQTTGIEVNSHQAGTVRAGTDPTTSVLDPTCRAHDVDNLYVVDSSFFPSLPVINPALTIAANAFRVAEHLTGQITQQSRQQPAPTRSTSPA
jgi:choline dehydrogenase-like flavoprotein